MCFAQLKIHYHFNASSFAMIRHQMMNKPWFILFSRKPSHLSLSTSFDDSNSKYFWRLFSFAMKFPSHQQIRQIFFKARNLGRCELVREAGKVSKERWTVPDHIVKPPYYETLNKPSLTSGKIEIKSDEQIAGMRESCRLAANILKKCGELIKVS